MPNEQQNTNFPPQKHQSFAGSKYHHKKKKTTNLKHTSKAPQFKSEADFDEHDPSTKGGLRPKQVTAESGIPLCTVGYFTPLDFHQRNIYFEFISSWQERLLIYDSFRYVLKMIESFVIEII